MLQNILILIWAKKRNISMSTFYLTFEVKPYLSGSQSGIIPNLVPRDGQSPLPAANKTSNMATTVDQQVRPIL